MSDHRARLEGRVLLVDDEEPVRDAYSRILRKLGCTVETAGSAVDALELIRARSFDVIVSDIGMSGMDGTQFLRVVRERDLHLPVILMTGNPRLDTAVKAVDEGAFRYLTKPIGLGVLEKAVRAALHKHALATILAEHRPLLETCHRIAETTCQNLGWDLAAIWMPDDAAERLRAVETWTPPGFDGASFEDATKTLALARGQDLPGRAWERGGPDWLADVSRDPSFSRAPQAAVAGLRSAVSMAVVADGQLFAVIELFSREPREPDLGLMELLAMSGEHLGARTLQEQAKLRVTQAETVERSINSTLDAVMACAPAFIMAIDAAGKIQFINRVLPGYKRKDVVGSSWMQYVPPANHELHLTHMERVLETGAAQTYETTALGADGSTHWFSTHMGPLHDNDRVVGVVIVAQEVTELRRTQAEYAAAQKLASLGTIAAGVAHELNTPVQFVTDSVQFLREATHDVFAVLDTLQTVHRLVGEGASPATVEEARMAAAEREDEADLTYLRENVPKAFDRCIDGLSRLATIVRSMKEFSHPAQQGMAPIDLNRALQNTLTIVHAEYKYVADLETDFGELPPVTCHVNDINQVLLNLVVNAAHAIADVVKGGDQKGTITVRTRQDGDSVVISVRDTGGGIPEAIGHRIFEPFFTTKDVGKGTGQGLALAWAVVKEKHAGELTFETTVGVGTTFFIRIPTAGKEITQRGFPGEAPRRAIETELRPHFD